MLHVHSEFSSLDGLSTVDEIAQRTLECGFPGGALTDHGVVAGHLDFEKAMLKHGLNPVFGCELYHGLITNPKGERDQAHLIALAMTDEGLKNLWRLTDRTSRQDHFHNVGRVFWDDIKDLHEGIVFTSACALGLSAKGVVQEDYTALEQYLNLLGHDFCIELSTYPGDRAFEDGTNQQLINERLWHFANEHGVRVTYGDDGHYAFLRQFPQHDLYLALQTGQTIFTHEEERTQFHPEGAVCMKDEAMVREALHYLPKSAVDEAIVNTRELVERATARTPEVRAHLPMFVPNECPWLNPTQQKLEVEELFIRLVVEGVHERYGKPCLREDVWDRVGYEVEILIHDNIHHYFLMGWDEIQACDDMGISRGPGRGSSAGCIVAYVLGITDVCPLHYGLIFERFWNSGRTDGFPDIDSDFSKRGRGRIIKYLSTRYGRDKVTAIGTVGRLKPKSVCDKLWRGLGISEQECNELKAIVGKTHDIEIHGVDQIGWSPKLEPGKVIYVEEDVGPEIEAWIDAGGKKRDFRRRYVDMCRLLCSRVSQYGVHASGIAICDDEIAPWAPAYRRGGKGDEGVPATQFAMDDIDRLHIIKLDVLGLRTLDTLDEWTAMVKERGIDVKWSGLDMKHHPDGMWDLLGAGYTAGDFQIETSYPTRLCELLEPHSVSDLAVIVALDRPGPIGDGTADRFIARRQGQEAVTYAHPRLEELLRPALTETLGLFVYQEQIIHYFNALGYTLSESDAVRKILGKKKPEKMNPLHDGTGEWEGRGYIEMTHAAGVPEKAAEGVWRGIERFASYSFNKSHAVCYGVIAFRCAYAKYYGPGQFYAACMRTVEGDKRKEMLPPYVNEARRLGLEVYPPDILRSRAQAAVDEDNNIWMGFSDVKGVKTGGPWLDYYRSQCDLNSPEQFTESFEAINKEYLKQKKASQKARLKGEEDPFPDLEAKSPKQKLGAGKIEAIVRVGAWDSIVGSRYSVMEKQQIEDELLEVILTDVSKEAFAANISEIETCDDYHNARLPWAKKFEAGEDRNHFRYRLPGVITGVEEKRARISGLSFGVVTIGYGPDELTFTVWHKKWKGDKFLFKMRTPGIFTILHRPPNEYGEQYTFEHGHILKP